MRGLSQSPLFQTLLEPSGQGGASRADPDLSPGQASGCGEGPSQGPIVLPGITPSHRAPDQTLRLLPVHAETDFAPWLERGCFQSPSGALCETRGRGGSDSPSAFSGSSGRPSRWSLFAGASPTVKATPGGTGSHTSDAAGHALSTWFPCLLAVAASTCGVFAWLLEVFEVLGPAWTPMPVAQVLGVPNAMTGERAQSTIGRPLQGPCHITPSPSRRCSHDGILSVSL